MPGTSKKTVKKTVITKPPFSFRRQILPPIVGVVAMVLMWALLNMQLVMAQLHYKFGSLPTVNVSTEALDLTQIDPSAPTQLRIPKIAVDAPIIFDELSTDEQKVQLALQRGVLHYGGQAYPGEKGNVVVIGHSSGAAWRQGNYKFVFTLLDKLEPGDRIMVDYKGTRYTYEVVTEEVIDPTNLSVLRQSATPELTLITCTPVGTDKNRLVIRAKQISPNPETAKLPKATSATPTSRLPQ